MHACSDISYMILTSGFNLRTFSHIGKRVVPNWPESEGWNEDLAHQIHICIIWQLWIWSWLGLWDPWRETGSALALAGQCLVSHCIGLLIETSLLPVSIGPPIGIGGVCRALKVFLLLLFLKSFSDSISPEWPLDSILATAPSAKYHLFSASVFHPKQSM